MICLQRSTLLVILLCLPTFGATSGLDTAISSGSCSYTFSVNREDGCSVNDGTLTQLQTTVNELQEQVTSLLQQNVHILQDNAFWRRLAQENLDKETPTSTNSGGGQGGSVFTHWGRTECSANSTVIYTGYAAGSYYTHTGGSSDILCLPEEPQWGRYVEGFQGQSYVYGSEYQVGDSNVFLTTNSGGQSLHDHDVPCAVCYISGRSTVKMYPAMVQCPDGWSPEYHGYLMAAHYAHKGNIKPVCLDEAPEVTESDYTNQDGALFYNMEAVCGSLPCPNYVSGRELTCAVCSR